MTPFYFLSKDVLPALLARLHCRRLSSAPAVQVAHTPFWHSSQSQRGPTVGVLRIRSTAGAHIFCHTWARIRVRRIGPGVWYQRPGGQGDHLHPAGSGQSRTGAPQGPGYHHLSAGPHYLPEHLHYLHLYFDVPLLRLQAALQLTVPVDYPPNPVSCKHTSMQRHSNTQDKVDMVSWKCVAGHVSKMSQCQKKVL